MDILRNRVLILPLLLILLFIASACGNGNGVREDDLITNNTPDTATLDEATIVTPATNQTSGLETKETFTKENATKENATKDTSTIETSTKDNIPKETSPEEALADEAPSGATPEEATPTTKSDDAEKVTSTSTPDVDEPDPPSTITISITSNEKKGVILEPTSVEWQDGDSVLDVLKHVTKSNKIPLEHRGSGMFSYVEGIANLYEFDHGASSGWLYKVNGEYSSKSAGSVKLNKGDNVEWIYSLELSEEPIE